MTSIDWAHLAIMLEVAAFLCVTPQFLGEKILKRISSPIIGVAKVFYTIPKLLIFAAFYPIKFGETKPTELWELSELPARVRSSFDELRKTTKAPAFWSGTLILLFAGPSLIVGVALLLVSHYRWLGYVIIGVILLSGLSFILILRFSFAWPVQDQQGILFHQ